MPTIASILSFILLQIHFRDTFLIYVYFLVILTKKILQLQHFHFFKCGFYFNLSLCVQIILWILFFFLSFTIDRNYYLRFLFTLKPPNKQNKFVDKKKRKSLCDFIKSYASITKNAANTSLNVGYWNKIYYPIALCWSLSRNLQTVRLFLFSFCWVWELLIWKRGNQQQEVKKA